jgi:protein TonB
LAQARALSAASARRPTQATAKRSPDAIGPPPVSVAVETTQTTANAQATDPDRTPSEESQVQTTLDAKDREKDSLRKCLAILRKRLQAKLIYPGEAKKLGYEGTAMPKFVITEEGTIRRGTLTVIQSSGDDDLDAAAFKAARAREPLDAPPKELEVVIAVAFELRH